MELQPGARTDAIPDERNEPDNAGGASLKMGGRYRPGRKGLNQMIITFLIAKIILGGYWLMLAPVLFLPLGIVFLSDAGAARTLWICGTSVSGRICGARGDFSIHSDLA